MSLLKKRNQAVATEDILLAPPRTLFSQLVSAVPSCCLVTFSMCLSCLLPDITKNTTRCAKIVNANQFDKDLASGTLPQLIYYTPDMNNDAHDTSIAFAGKWLRGFLPGITSRLPPRTLIMITWDEDDATENNRIYSALLGPGIAAGTTDNTKYTHYSITATLEANWGLGTLGRNDVGAAKFLQ